jgi:hypothetical protein
VVGPVVVVVEHSSLQGSVEQLEVIERPPWKVEDPVHWSSLNKQQLRATDDGCLRP